jgi:hypothetical protein
MPHADGCSLHIENYRRTGTALSGICGKCRFFCGSLDKLKPDVCRGSPRNGIMCFITCSFDPLNIGSAVGPFADYFLVNKYPRMPRNNRIASQPAAILRKAA